MQVTLARVRPHLLAALDFRRIMSIDQLSRLNVEDEQMDPSIIGAQTFEVSKAGEQPSVVRIISETSKGLTESYERLRWLGFSAMSGVLIIIACFVCSLLPVVSLPIQSQILYAAIGFGIFLSSAAVFALQNVHAFRLENRNREFALKSLELKHEVTKAIIAEPPAKPPVAPYTPPPG